MSDSSSIVSKLTQYKFSKWPAGVAEGLQTSVNPVIALAALGQVSNRAYVETTRGAPFSKSITKLTLTPPLPPFLHFLLRASGVVHPGLILPFLPIPSNCALLAPVS
jgi:hypothetical protein